MRNSVISKISKTKWFEEGLNRGARSIPLGFNEETVFPKTEHNDYTAIGFEDSLLKEITNSALGQKSFMSFLEKS